MPGINPYSFLYDDVWFVDETAGLIFYEGGLAPLISVSTPEPPAPAPATRVIRSPRYGITRVATR